MISDLSQFNSLGSALDRVTSNLQQIQQQLATGKRVNAPSDDPAAYATASSLNAEQSAASNDAALGAQIQGRLTTMDGAFATAANAINSAITTATQGADATVNASQMATLATQVQGALQQLVSAANQRYLNAYVFAGNQSLNAPFSGAGAYSGDSGGNSVTFSNGVTAQLSFDGKAIFGDNTGGAIGAMLNLVSALQSGNKAAVSAVLPQLQTALQVISSARATLGTGLATINGVVSDANSQVTSLTGAISKLTDLDVATAVAKENQAQLQQQARVSLASEMAKKPLVNVLA
jgi:flagellar hook-associated protein 3 FlgL